MKQAEDFGIFPLPLTLWEEFFVVDDYEHYPANFLTRIRCQGRVPEELFLRALSHCEKSHPLFSACIVRQGKRLTWQKVDQEELPVRFESLAVEPELPLVTKLNAPGKRLWRIDVREWQLDNGQWRADILVNIHHALCDGLGAIQFISDVAKEIHDLHLGMFTEAPPEANDVQGAVDGSSVGKRRPLRDARTDSQLLVNRGKFPQSWSEFFRNLPSYYRSVLASLRLVFTRVAALFPLDDVVALMDQPKEYLGYYKIDLTPRLSSQLRRYCRQENTTVNSLVAAELFQAIHDWKIDHGDMEFQALRVVMPFNERTLADRNLPACNRVSLSPFTRKRSELADHQKLRSSIENGVRAVKKFKLGVNFHRGLWFCKYLLGGLKRLAKTDRIGATCMFANVGNLHAHLGLPVKERLTQCGPFLIEDVDLIPPVRIGTSFAMTLHEFDGSTRLGIHYDSNLAQKSEFESFFQYFHERILKRSEPQR